MIITKVVEYQCGADTFKGYIAYDDSIKEPKPGVIIGHAWMGQDDFARKKAEELAKLGYVGFAADVYGNGLTVSTVESATEQMFPLFMDRQLLRDRIVAAYNVLSNFEEADRNRLGAIGFCFGGLTVIELLRSGVKLRGIVSFHGLLGFKLGEMTAKKVSNAAKMHGALLVLHGYLDPMTSIEDIRGFQEEMTTSGVDWQMHTYGNATHAFMNPLANMPEAGMLYNPITERRAWKSMCNFFDEIFIMGRLK